MIYLSFILVILSIYLTKHTQLHSGVKWPIAAGLLLTALWLTQPLLGTAAAIVALVASVLLSGILVAMLIKRS
ncbi:hypothetical protein [Shewanella waksmanii]|uniref:hypothetical protein n=1 Tax=Shewanella waksmanii TaxID=213783 RepID=UPI00048C1F9D|nr:hypothetical protein [Shewanella waksmanii]